MTDSKSTDKKPREWIGEQVRYRDDFTGNWMKDDVWRGPPLKDGEKIIVREVLPLSPDRQREVEAAAIMFRDEVVERGYGICNVSELEKTSGKRYLTHIAKEIPDLVKRVIAWADSHPPAPQSTSDAVDILRRRYDVTDERMNAARAEDARERDEVRVPREILDVVCVAQRMSTFCSNAGNYGPLGLSPGECRCVGCDMKNALAALKEKEKKAP